MPGPDRIRWGLVIHGGVGVLPEEDLTGAEAERQVIAVGIVDLYSVDDRVRVPVDDAGFGEKVDAVR